MSYEAALSLAIYVNIPIMAAVAVILWGIVQRLAVVETTLKHVNDKINGIEVEKGRHNAHRN